ncbi:hypothetical protein F2Q69_00021785 [Brassica cretica]|uniref:Uncharacterized protein n=1 Tax=Brassica cretica TaxID=69181 RepID=A0A8S9Q367_BRACR|nr:hypothetical protein F2Q69_00021785 [Brassica cretica]
MGSPYGDQGAVYGVGALWLPIAVRFIFFVKSHRKLRLGRNERHFDRDSKQNNMGSPYGDLEAVYGDLGAIFGDLGVVWRLRVVLLVFFLKSHQKLRLGRNERQFSRGLKQEGREGIMLVAIWRAGLASDRSPYGDPSLHGAGRHMATRACIRPVIIW